jgi:mannitol/fructose-specific phosphotransferase system IIA component (Ntr-type)
LLQESSKSKMTETVSLSKLLDADAICLDLPVATKEELIRSCVDLLGEAGFLDDRDAVFEALIARERVMSTGIGGGVAIPHAQSSGAREISVCLVRTQEDLSFDALDGKPVRLVFLITGPEERGGFIRILARISRLLYTGDLQRNLLQAASPGEVIEIVRREEEKLRV